MLDVRPFLTVEADASVEHCDPILASNRSTVEAIHAVDEQRYDVGGRATEDDSVEVTPPAAGEGDLVG